MKKLEELGISPAPWRMIPPDCLGADVKAFRRRKGRISTMVLHDGYIEDARLIAAAPELYEALLEALPWLADIGAEVVGNEAAEKIAVVVAKAEAALAKASGEGEVNQ